eukprot:scaffold7799_cov39-Prasinocladus_malaysianus.AAC.2
MSLSLKSAAVPVGHGRVSLAQRCRHSKAASTTRTPTVALATSSNPRGGDRQGLAPAVHLRCNHRGHHYGASPAGSRCDARPGCGHAHEDDDFRGRLQRLLQRNPVRALNSNYLRLEMPQLLSDYSTVNEM